jgi:hypothetical protein
MKVRVMQRRQAHSSGGSCRRGGGGGGVEILVEAGRGSVSVDAVRREHNYREWGGWAEHGPECNHSV